MIYIILGFFVGAGLVLIFSRSARHKILRPAQDKLVGICEVVLGQSTKKRDNKDKILALLAEKGELGNSDIREALEVSPKTIINYLDELEREGKVEQIGNTGRGVAYKLKNP